MGRRIGDFKALTFDCYGTLIDWETGIWGAVQPLIARQRLSQSGDFPKIHGQSGKDNSVSVAVKKCPQHFAVNALERRHCDPPAWARSRNREVSQIVADEGRALVEIVCDNDAAGLTVWNGGSVIADNLNNKAAIHDFKNPPGE